MTALCRTAVSGVRAEDLQGAPTLKEVQEKVAELLKGRILVGHAVENDMHALLLSHPRKDIRDTSRYPPLMKLRGDKLRPRALRHLAKEVLGLDIQEGAHSPVDDARCALYLYQRHKREWEGALKAAGGSLRGLKERTKVKMAGGEAALAAATAAAAAVKKNGPAANADGKKTAAAAAATAVPGGKAGAAAASLFFQERPDLYDL